MNETLRTIAERYSCRDFESTELTAEQVDALVDAALAAPSAMNRQPWHLIVINDKALMDELDKAGMAILAQADDDTHYQRIKSRGGKILYNAPAMIIVLADDSEYAQMDSGILSQNVALAAQSLGLGSVINATIGVPFKGPGAKHWKKKLQFPEGYEFAIAVVLGTPRSSKEPHDLDRTKVTVVLS